MTVTHETHQKRFCDGGTELLRLVTTAPHLAVSESGEDPAADALGAFHDFYRELLGRTQTFAEKTLLPSLKAEFDALPPHDRKFHPPKRVYEVSVTAAVREEEPCVSVTLQASLKRKGTTDFETTETQYWRVRNGVLALVPPPR